MSQSFCLIAVFACFSGIMAQNWNDQQTNSTDSTTNIPAVWHNHHYTLPTTSEQPRMGAPTSPRPGDEYSQKVAFQLKGQLENRLGFGIKNLAVQEYSLQAVAGTNYYFKFLVNDGQVVLATAHLPLQTDPSQIQLGKVMANDIKIDDDLLKTLIQ